jgi:hypothetical protein
MYCDIMQLVLSAYLLDVLTPTLQSCPLYTRYLLVKSDIIMIDGAQSNTLMCRGVDWLGWRG